MYHAQFAARTAKRFSEKNFSDTRSILPVGLSGMVARISISAGGR